MATSHTELMQTYPQHFDTEGHFILSEEERAYMGAAKPIHAVKAIRNRCDIGLRDSKAVLETTEEYKAWAAANIPVRSPSLLTLPLAALIKALYDREPRPVTENGTNDTVTASHMYDAASAITSLKAYITELDVPPVSAPTARAKATILQLGAKLAREGRSEEAKALRDAVDALVSAQSQLVREVAMLKGVKPPELPKEA